MPGCRCAPPAPWRAICCCARPAQDGDPCRSAELVAVDGEVRRRDGTEGRDASASWSTSSAVSRPMPPPPLKQPSEFKLIGTLAAPARHPGQGRGHGDLRHRRAPARPALRRGAQRADLRRRGRRLHGQERRPAQGHREGRDRAGRHCRDRHELVAGRQASSTRASRSQWQAGPEPKLDSADLWKRYEELLESGKVALDAQARHRADARDGADRRGDLSRALSRACADGADELHGAVRSRRPASRASSSGCRTSRRP